MKPKRLINTFKTVVLLLVLAIMMGCGGKVAVVPDGVMDNSQHHTFTGMNLLEEGRTSDALDQFERAIAIDDKYAPAYAGKALTYLSVKNVEDAKKNANESLDLAKTDNHKILAHLTMMQVYYEKREGNWLKKVVELCEQKDHIQIGEMLGFILGWILSHEIIGHEVQYWDAPEDVHQIEQRITEEDRVLLIDYLFQNDVIVSSVLKEVFTSVSSHPSLRGEMMGEN